jgi:hypothetical protein
MVHKQKQNPFKAGEKVWYKDGDPEPFYVYAVYSPTKVSLSIRGYKDAEQDFLTDVSKITKQKPR